MQVTSCPGLTGWVAADRLAASSARPLFPVSGKTVRPTTRKEAEEAGLENVTRLIRRLSLVLF